MSYKKNKSKMAHDAFADKFNHKKTIHNDNKRFQNINVKSNSVIKVEISEFTDITDNEINNHFFNNSNSIHMPKIVCKENLLPTHLEGDNFDFTMINKNINMHMEMVAEEKINGPVSVETVSYTHLTLPTKRIV